jgi:hypothetical protein
MSGFCTFSLLAFLPAHLSFLLYTCHLSISLPRLSICALGACPLFSVQCASTSYLASCLLASPFSCTPLYQYSMLVNLPSCWSPFHFAFLFTFFMFTIVSACPAFYELWYMLVPDRFLPAFPFYTNSTYSPATLVSLPLCLSQYLFLPVRLSSCLSKILFSFLLHAPFFCVLLYMLTMSSVYNHLSSSLSALPTSLSKNRLQQISSIYSFL